MPRSQHLILAVLFTTVGASGCRLTRGEASCTSSNDCDPGNMCNDGLCVIPTGCEQFPPLACQQPQSDGHAVSYTELQRLLPGRWLWCSGAPLSQSPTTQDPPDAVGFAFADDLSRWWFLFDDGAGHPVPRQGFGTDGTINIIVGGAGPSFTQLDMLEVGNGGFALHPVFEDGPPLRMGLALDVGYTIYIHDDSACGDVADRVDMAIAPVDGGGVFGQSCNPNTVTSTSCPSIDGVACSVCLGGAFACSQPCHVGGAGCPAGQTCMPQSMSPEAVILAGDCANYDGYCM